MDSKGGPAPSRRCPERSAQHPHLPTLTHSHSPYAEDPDNPNPSKWHAIAKHVPNRTNKDCRKRWFAKMANDVVKGGWSPQEDEKLVKGIDRYGTRSVLFFQSLFSDSNFFHLQVVSRCFRSSDKEQRSLVLLSLSIILAHSFLHQNVQRGGLIRLTLLSIVLRGPQKL